MGAFSLIVVINLLNRCEILKKISCESNEGAPWLEVTHSMATSSIEESYSSEREFVHVSPDVVTSMSEGHFSESDSGDFGGESTISKSFRSPLRRNPSGLTVKQIQEQIKGVDTESSGLTSSLESSLSEKSVPTDLLPRVPPHDGGGTIVHLDEITEEERSAMKASAILKNQKKHMFILSTAGKPIYTRHSCEDDHLPLFGIMTALVSFVNLENDTLNSIRTKDRLFVFLSKPPLLFVGVSGLMDSVNQLARQLTYMYNQVISIVCAKTLQARFKARENYDLRRLLDESGRKYLDGMCDMMENNLSVLLGAVHCVKLKGSVRDLIGRSLVVDVKDLVFNVLIAKNQLIQYAHMRSCMLQASDMHILFNLIARTGNFRDTDIAHWLPICLPGFDENGFLHALVSYLDENTCLIMLSVASDAFTKLKDVRDQIKIKLTRNNCFQDIANGLRETDSFNVSHTGLYGLRHYMYKHRHLLQFTSPAFSVPYDTSEEQSRLFQLYKQIHHKIHLGPRPFRVVYHATDSEVLLGWLTGELEIYCCFSPVIVKDDAVAKVNKVAEMVRNEEDKLFLVNAYTF